jgi:2-polyprenyl-6-methoxyphenol hydroxylase-like FAD-dependent oxidoreductase
MKVIIAGAGIGGLTAALSLHQAGIEVEVFEQAPGVAELGVGINVLPQATRELAALGLLRALDCVGIRTGQLIYMNRLGQVIWREPRGLNAGYDAPQFSIHHGKLHGLLARVAAERLGRKRLNMGCQLIGFDARRGCVVAHFHHQMARDKITVVGDALVGCDGIHSTVRSILYPNEGQPIWSGSLLWRGTTDWPVYGDGQTMVIAGGNAAKFVFYPIGATNKPTLRLTNWGVMARIASGSGMPPIRQDWCRSGHLGEALQFVRRFRLGSIDPAAIIEDSSTFLEFPNCDRDPLPQWSFGRATLLGDAAHPMYPVGSNGASQAILDARSLTRHLSSSPSVVDALVAYDAERRPLTNHMVLSNRKGGPEGIIDMIESRAPEGFDDIDGVATYTERRTIVQGYARMAGVAPAWAKASV